MPALRPTLPVPSIQTFIALARPSRPLPSTSTSTYRGEVLVSFLEGLLDDGGELLSGDVGEREAQLDHRLHQVLHLDAARALPVHLQKELAVVEVAAERARGHNAHTHAQEKGVRPRKKRKRKKCMRTCFNEGTHATTLEKLQSHAHALHTTTHADPGCICLQPQRSRPRCVAYPL